LQQGIDAGRLRPVDPRQTTIGLGSLLFGATVLGSHLKAVPVAEMTEFAVDIFLRGILAENPTDHSNLAKVTDENACATCR
jgi:hypothetical protein